MKKVMRMRKKMTTLKKRKMITMVEWKMKKRMKTILMKRKTPSPRKERTQGKSYRIEAIY